MKNPKFQSSEVSENPVYVQVENCPLCPKVFPRFADLEQHITSHVKEKPFKCDDCDFSTAWRQTFERHVDKNHEPRSVWEKRLKYKCQLCAFKTWKPTSLKIHMAKHTEDRNFPCNFTGCSYRAKTSRVLSEHYSRLHCENDRASYPCQVEGCLYKGKEKSLLVQHMIKHSVERPFGCFHPNCAYTAKSRGPLNSHLKLMHGETDKWYSCSFGDCSFKTRHRSSMQCHTTVHTNIKNYVCSYPDCKYKSRTPQGLRSHSSIHEEIKPLACPFPQCSFRAAVKNRLSQHMRSHNEDRPFPCTFDGCKFQAKTTSNLKLHQETHNKIPHIPCPIPECSYLARYKASLGVHIRQHGINPGLRVCPEAGCTYSAQNSNSFLMHQKLHSRGTEFACPFCPKFFSNKSNLEVHSFTHTKERPFKCAYCDYGCYEKKMLMLHCARHHKGEKPRCVLLRPTPGTQCKYCRFRGSENAVVRHAARRHKVVVILERILISIV